MAIYISEVDKTSAEPINPNTFVALIPIKSKSMPGGDEYYFTETDDGTTKSFEKLFKSDADGSNLGYNMAYYLLKLGLPIYVATIDGQSDLEDYDKFWKKFEDKNLYDLRFITTGDFRNTKIAQYAIQCAAKRGDAVAVVDIPDPVESGAEMTEKYVDNWVNSLALTNITRENGVIENPFTYGTVFAPRFEFKDSFSAGYYPGSFDYLACFAYHIQNYPEWFATAGSIRGVSPFEDVVPLYKYGAAAEAIFQARTLKDTTQSHKATNLIELVRPYGNIIWGARTLYPLKVEDGKVGLKASSFLNIRQLCCSLKKTLYAASKKFTFEPNSDVLWANFKAEIKPLLEEMKSNQGIKGYDFIKEKVAEKATLKATIKIIPVEPVEDFNLTVYMTDSVAEVTVSE